MALIVSDYFSEWRNRRLECPCGWHGDSSGMRMELTEATTDYDCPECEATLLVVSHPDLAQVQAAAASGNAEARGQLEMVEQARRHVASRNDAKD